MQASGYRWIKVFSALFLAAGGSPQPCGANSKNRGGELACPADEVATIQSVASCANSPGFVQFAAPADLSDADGWNDGRVQSVCGSHGKFTRLHAWSTWMQRLKDFEDQCYVNGGEFSFADPGFSEPQNESFCYPAQLQRGYTSFEDPTVNVIAACPSQQVACRYSCRQNNMAAGRSSYSQTAAIETNLTSIVSAH